MAKDPDPIVARWLKEITKSHTREIYRWAWKKFHGLNPKLTGRMLIEEAQEDLKRGPLQRKRIVAQRIKDTYLDLKKQGASDNTALTVSAALRSFYSYYDFKVNLKGSNKLPRAKKKNHRIMLNPNQVKTLADHARNPRDRALIWILFQGMFDASTICSLNYFNVKRGLESNEYPLPVMEITRPKTDVFYYTFVLRESIEALKAYLADCKARGITFKDSSPLFLKERGGKRLTENLIQIMLSEVAQKAGFVDQQKNGNGQNPLGPHALRESGTSRLSNSGMPDSMVLFLSGHEVGSIAEAYLKREFESVKNMYLEKGEKNLSVQVGEVVKDEKIERLAMQIAMQKKEVEDLKATLQVVLKQDTAKSRIVDGIKSGKFVVAFNEEGKPLGIVPRELVPKITTLNEEIKRLEKRP
jgi:integrase